MGTLQCFCFPRRTILVLHQLELAGIVPMFELKRVPRGQLEQGTQTLSFRRLCFFYLLSIGFLYAPLRSPKDLACKLKVETDWKEEMEEW